jgi:hypothetical protein
MAKFRKAHYEQVAKILSSIQPDTTADNNLLRAYWRHSVRKLSRHFQGDNSRFDSKKFEEACGFTPTELNNGY